METNVPSDDEPLTKKQQRTLDALKLLLDFQKWTYDTYQKDSNFFLAIEILLFGGVANAIWVKSLDAWSSLVVLIGVGLGIFLTICWISRQRREYHLSKGRLTRLQDLEKDLPTEFQYFGTVYLESKEPVKNTKRLPLFVERLNIIPNVYRFQSFLYSLVLQQSMLVAWFLIGLVVVARWIKT